MRPRPSNQRWAAATRLLVVCAGLFILGPAAGVRAEPGLAAPSPVPLTRAHAHNDYEHARPLLDALDHGFCSVEADVYLVNGQLLVAHDRNRTSPDRTLGRLYLEPLRDRARRNGGRVYPGGPSCLLFIDLKSEAESTYSALGKVLSSYADLVTRFEGQRVVTNAVTVIISGNRPRQTMATQPLRYAACDGRAQDLDSDVSPTLVPVVSDRWGSYFQWRGQGAMPAEEAARLREFVAKAHAGGRKLRFWGTPDHIPVWQTLFDADVDLINTDDLPGLRDFLLSHQPAAASAQDAGARH